MEKSRFNYANEVFRSLLKLVETFTTLDNQGMKGTALPAKDRTYVERVADEELYQFLQSDEIGKGVCCILGSPQMGKSSLMAKTAHKLSKEKYICFQITLNQSAPNISESSFYLSILRIVCNRFKSTEKNLIGELDSFWAENQNLLPMIQFQRFLKDLLSSFKIQKLILFIDNIEKLIDWKIQDSFMRMIKELCQSHEESIQKVTFVLLGTANPWDLLTDASYASEVTKIELESFQGDCEPLLAGLKKVSKNPGVALNEILYWTGGQPFLTQALCHLVGKRFKIDEANDLEINGQIGELVKTEILQDQRIDIFDSHFQKINNWFIRGDPDRIDRELYALNLYNSILSDRESCEFSDRSLAQRDLLISGLVAKFDNILEVANPIYRQVFTEKWVEETKQAIKQQRCNMPSPKLYNRDVFMLIDKSTSMDDKDPETGGLTRWEFLAKELVSGHVNKILKQTSPNGEKICEEVYLTFFSINRPSKTIIPVTNSAQVETAFKEVGGPEGQTFIVPTLSQILDQWYGIRKGRGGFVIIYTDGTLSDRAKFEELIKRTCTKLESQDELKIVILGVGSEIDPLYYVELDFNMKKFETSTGMPCNIVVFDLINELEEGIIEVLNRQLEFPEKGLPVWVKERYPDWYRDNVGF